MSAGHLINSLAGLAKTSKAGVGVYVYPGGDKVNITVKRGDDRRDLLYSMEQIDDAVPTPDAAITARVMWAIGQLEKEAQP